MVTTAEELELFELVSSIVAESAVKRPIAYKDTTAYFGINLGRVGQWFLRAFMNGPKKCLVTRVTLEPAQLLARGFVVEAAPDGLGLSRIYFNTVKDVEKLRALVLVAFEEEVRRVEAGAGDDDTK